ncbi:hypothetical protein JKF63_04392 [Porcisia hertigi]|uniref:Glucoamylase-like protein n=1 Tax=Porcisia hertigi TaxID=2761500 RepID=A0A836II94_9TRYP|nr:hypothetical protein JKF63_04392 [Porcisia hertigi]
MSRSFPYPSSSTEVVVGQRSYACLPGERATESMRTGKGLPGRWADALLKNTPQGTASAALVMDVASQLTHQPLLQRSSQPSSAGTGAACASPRQRQKAAGDVASHRGGNKRRSNSPTISAAPSRTMAVGVHPPLSRGSMRAVNAAPPVSTANPSGPASVGSLAQTNDSEPTLATLASDMHVNQTSPSRFPLVVTGSAGGGTGAPPNSIAPKSGTHRSPKPTTSTRDQRPTRASAPVSLHPEHFQGAPHSHRGGGGSVRVHWSGDSGCEIPIASAATPHTLPVSYATSQFFQRVGEVAPTSRCTSGATRVAPSRSTAVAHDDERNSLLQLQDATPVMSAGNIQKDVQPRKQPGEAAHSEAGNGQFSYDDGIAAHDDDGGGMHAVLSATTAAALSPSSLLPSARITVLAGEAPPCVQPAPCSLACDPAHQQHVFYSHEPSISQVMPTNFSFQSPSSSETVQFSGTPGGLSASRSITACSTAPRRSCVALSGFAAQSSAMSFVGHLATPESVSGHFSGIYVSPPPSTSQVCASVSDSAQRLAFLPAPDSKSQRCQEGPTTGSSRSVRVQVLHQEHPSHQSYPIDGACGKGAHDGTLPSSRPSRRTPQFTSESGLKNPSAMTRATMFPARQGPSTLAIATTPQSDARPALIVPPAASDQSGATLDKQLLYASKSELAQLLLELAGCNPEASHFIRSKAFLFSFRNGHDGEPVRAWEAYSGDTPTTTAADIVAAHTNGGRDARGGGSGCGTTSEALNMSSCDGTGERSVVFKQPVAGAVAHDHAIARCIFPVEAAEEEDGDGNDCSVEQRVTGRLLTKGVADTKMPLRHPCPEARAFSAELHPCLRWYGACRNATSCVFVSLPRNVCLNWIRGSCMAQTECSGVHRLPSPCPPDICDIYKLNHGLLRRDTHGASLVHRHPIPPPFLECTPKTHAPIPSGGVDAETFARPKAGLFTAEFERSCTGANGGHIIGAGTAEELCGEKVEVHTPTNQYIHKDTFPVGNVRPHRPPHECDLELCNSASSILGRTGGAKAASDGHAILRDSSNTATTADVVGPVDQEMLQYTNGTLGAGAAAGASSVLFYPNAPPRSQMSGMLPPDSSSRCSTAEGYSSHAESVSRCLGPHFDRAATAVPGCDDSRPDSGVIGLAVQQQRPDAKNMKSICDCICNATEPFLLAPTWSFGGDTFSGSLSDAAGGLAEVDDECEFSAPAVGTRTRVQSPLYQRA